MGGEAQAAENSGKTRSILCAGVIVSCVPLLPEPTRGPRSPGAQATGIDAEVGDMAPREAAAAYQCPHRERLIVWESVGADVIIARDIRAVHEDAHGLTVPRHNHVTWFQRPKVNAPG
jgi:hypothetical protein